MIYTLINRIKSKGGISMKGKLLKKMFAFALSAVMVTGAAVGMTSLPASARGGGDRVVAYEELANTSTISTNALTLGQYAVIKASATGGSGGYTFALQYINKDKDTSWKLKRYYSSYPTINFKPDEPGNYYLYVKAKDSSGEVVGKRFALKVSPDIVNKSTLSKTEIYLGDTVTVNAKATGGAGENTYAVLYKKSSDTKWSVKQYYSDNTSVDIKPLRTEDYDVAVKVKDKNGRISEKKLTLKVYAKLKNTSIVSAASVEPGGTVTVTGAAEGGKPGYTYSLMVKEKNDSSWSVVRAKDAEETMTFTPEKEGTYTLCSVARDVKNTAAKKYFNLTVEEKELDDVDRILAEAIKPGMSDLEKIRAIHNWLVRNVRYDTEGLASGNIPETSFTAEGLFETRIAVCDGYAKAFVVLATRAGFDAIRVTGTGFNGSSTELHAWNQVKWNGNWYNVDVTWDDPVTDSDYGDNLQYTYFMIPDSVIDLDHNAQSEKNSCTSPQPVDQFIENVIDEEKQALPNVVFCNTQEEFESGVSAINIWEKTTHDFIIKTELSYNELVNLAKRNLPMGTYSWGASYKTWKLAGYVHFAITIS